MRARPLASPAPFVGRADELALLGARLDAALAGAGSVVLLSGEAGIGKTRLVEELTGAATGRGAQVLWGRCTEVEGAPPLWPWVQLIRALARGRDPSTLAAAVAGRGPVLAALAPELFPAGTARRARRTAWDSSPSSEAERFRLFDGVTSAVRSAATSQPLVLAFDDLHWADVPSLLCLQLLAQEIDSAAVLVLGTFHDAGLEHDAPRARVLNGLGRDRRTVRMTLGGLSERETEGLVDLLLAGSAQRSSATLTRGLYRRTAGNPLFVYELLRHLDETGRLAESDPPGDGFTSAVPAGIRDVVERRIALLSPAAIRVLRLAAVLGQQFRLAVLNRAAELEGMPLLAGLDEALAARIILPATGGVGSYRFSHAVVRDAIYDALALSERAGLHLQAGEALAAFHAPAVEQHLAELAHHFMQAAQATALGAVRAADYTRRAGDAALARFAYEDAARHYDLALQALDLGGTAAEGGAAAERCSLLVARGDALNRAGETAAAREALLLAAAAARERPEPEPLARAALGLAELQEETGRVDETRVALFQEALARLHDDQVVLRALLLARLAKARPAHPHSQALGRDAIALARRSEDPSVLVDVLYAVRYVLWSPDNLAERLAQGAEMVALAVELDDDWWLRVAQAFQYSDLLELGDPAAAEAARAVLARPTAARQTAHQQWYALVLVAMQTLTAGRLAAGEQLCLQALSTGQAAQIPDALQSFGVQIAYVRYMQGRFSELESVVAGLVLQYPGTPSWRATLALIYAESGRVAEAREHFDRLAASGFAVFPRDRSWLVGIANCAEVCALLDEHTHAAVLYDLLLAHAGQNMVIALATIWYGPVDRQLGLLAGTLGRFDAAADHFERALAMLDRMPSPPLRARIEAEFASLLLRRGERTDRKRARHLLASAATAAHALGLARVGALIAQVRVDEPAPHPARAPALPDGLTAREATVLSLLAAGRTNREIAETLAVSPFTVARHITNLYAKIGARGRAEATAYALRHGLS